MEQNELDFVNDKALRDRVAGRVEVLDKVKKLLLLPKLEMMTSAQVAEYYDVNLVLLRKCYQRNKAEIDADGTLVGTLDFLKLHYVTLESEKGFVVFDAGNGITIKIPNRGIRMFSQRAILRIGMLLRDSPIAREVRTQLLNTAEHATDGQKTADIDEEQTLLLSLGIAFSSGDFDGLSEAAMRLNAFKQRHIDRLTKQVAELEPKGRYYDHVLQAEDLTPITVIAKDYGWSAQRMNSYLNDKGIQFKRDGTWVLYQKYAENGYTGTKTHAYTDTAGRDRASVNTLWTQRGRLFLYNTLKADGFLPTMERDTAHYNE